MTNNPTNLTLMAQARKKPVVAIDSHQTGEKWLK
jgi:hypothetical protein